LNLQDLLFIQPAGAIFPVPGDERDCVPVFQKLQRALHLIDRQF
jgi:hypothetical protein